MGTFIVSLVLIIVIGAIVGKMISNKKRGKLSCSCGGNCCECRLCKTKFTDPLDFKSPCQ